MHNLLSYAIKLILVNGFVIAWFQINVEAFIVRIKVEDSAGARIRVTTRERMSWDWLSYYEFRIPAVSSWDELICCLTCDTEYPISTHLRGCVVYCNIQSGKWLLMWSYYWRKLSLLTSSYCILSWSSIGGNVNSFLPKSKYRTIPLDKYWYIPKSFPKSFPKSSVS
jgi:hypothetical protein